MKFRIPLLLLFLTLDAHADSRRSESLIANRLDGTKVSYYLFNESKTEQSEVLLLVLQGSDCRSVLQIESIFIHYRNVWPKADLLLIEKYGIGNSLNHNSNAEVKDCPAEYLKKDSPKQRVSDINIVLDTVRKSHIYEKLIVIGGSEGAVVANLFAAKNPSVDATISFNGGGRWFLDDVLHNMGSVIDDEEEAKVSIAGFKRFAEQVQNGEPFDLEVSGHKYNWWHQMLSIDQLESLHEVNSPLLIVQGGIDLAVSPREVDKMVSALRKSGKDNIQYITYENLDHGFSDAAGQSELGKVITEMNAWLRSTLKNNPNKSMQPTANAAVD